MTHKHSFRWRTDGVAPPWHVYAECYCGEVATPSFVANTQADLQDQLKAAFHADLLSPLGYFTAPVFVPFETRAIG